MPTYMCELATQQWQHPIWNATGLSMLHTATTAKIRNTCSTLLSFYHKPCIARMWKSLSRFPQMLSLQLLLAHKIRKPLSLYTFPKNLMLSHALTFFGRCFWTLDLFFFFLLQSTLFSPSITVSEDKFSITFLYLGLKFVLSVGFELYRPFNCLWCFFLHSCELSICLNCQSLLPANFLALVSTIVGCQSFKFSSRLLLSWCTLAKPFALSQTHVPGNSPAL